MVSTLQGDGKPAPAACIGDIQENSGQAGEPFRSHFHSAQGVLEVNVESRREEHHIGFEFKRDRLQDGPENLYIFIIAGARPEGHVDRVTLARSPPHLLGAARARVIGILVGGEINDPGIVVKGVLCPVSMVKVPVHHENSFHLMFLDGVHGADGHIVKEAESRGPVGLGMVPGRSHEGEGILDVPPDDGVYGIVEPAHGQPRCFVRLRRGFRIGVKIGMSLSRRLRDRLNVPLLMNHPYFFCGRVRRFDQGEFILHVRGFEHLVYGFQSFGRFGMEYAGFMHEVSCILHNPCS